MTNAGGTFPSVVPRSKLWWLGLALLLLLAGWLYLRGYNVSLPYIDHVDEPHHLLAAQHLIVDGSARAVGHEAYPPGMSRLNYLLLKHVKPPEAHHGSMLPALRLITITAWMLTIVVIALLGCLAAHPLTGLMAAAIWIVNPWVVERAHWALPDAYVTLFTLLSLWLSLVGCLYRRRRFSTAAVYSLMLGIVFKTTALFVAPLVLLLPLVGLRREQRFLPESGRHVFWNCLRFSIFVFWLLLLHPTLDSHQIYNFPVTERRVTLPQLSVMSGYLIPVLLTFQSLAGWLGIALAGVLCWRYRRRHSIVVIVTVGLGALSWLLAFGVLQVRGDQMRQFFAFGALLSVLYGVALTNLIYAGQEVLDRFESGRLPARARNLLAPVTALLLLAVGLLPAYRDSDALAHDYSLPDRRNDLANYMDTSLEPGKFIANYENHNVFNRPWGGYDGTHDFEWHQEYALLWERPIEQWRAFGADYAIMPYWYLDNDPKVYYPGETVLLKTYPSSDEYRGPSMVVLRLYPMQYEAGGQLGPIRLTGYDLNAAELAPGENIVIRHYWKADTPTTTAMRVFNHLLDSGGSLKAQNDYIPLWDARRDTTKWDDPAETMLGRKFTISLPGDLSAGEYALVTGFYDPETGHRLTADSGADHILVSDITVIAAS